MKTFCFATILFDIAVAHVASNDGKGRLLSEVGRTFIQAAKDSDLGKKLGKLMDELEDEYFGFHSAFDEIGPFDIGFEGIDLLGLDKMDYGGVRERRMTEAWLMSYKDSAELERFLDDMIGTLHLLNETLPFGESVPAVSSE